ncbi:Nitrogen regulation protein NR(I) [Pseudobythopirellula maris]|uniref:DNA-binding transcriptional regulator NtrC n=1 Tax=Pseudobythopirellula maris TaxID=2527991 RepID=A0A5C5ZSU7_9BACT|nr:sigma-54 dependent transcriptional regulator [Pseudobythopirellula maris]TWT89851.1 Nitrogen regulation protein NR(I) [Pseudobythopirellula maris]
MANVLVIDDEQSICWGLKRLCEGLGHSVTTAPSAEEGLRVVKALPPDLVLLDVRLPGVDGLTAMERMKALAFEAPIIVMTAFGDMKTAVAAVQGGAFEYLLKPFDLAEVRSAITRALRSEPPSAATPAPSLHGEMIGDTAEMQALFKQIALAASARANVMLQGESGVGKELAARAVHRHSANSSAPFVAVNVAALSPTVAESELFGHVDGSFTGASRTRAGLLARAHGGTLFLDEAGDIPMPLQVKLLRAIEEGEVLPVGADRTTPARFRVITATHQDLLSQVQAGEFRHDLYFRISAFQIAIPPLRERADDIPLLAQHFLSLSESSEKPIALASETLAELKRRPWRGNVRELRNAIEHAQVLARSGTILPEHLPAPQPWLGAAEAETADARLSDVSVRRAEELLDDPEAFGTVYSRLLGEVEGPLLARAMAKYDNECAPAARALGLHRTTLKRKLTEHGQQS